MNMSSAIDIERLLRDSVVGRADGRVVRASETAAANEMGEGPCGFGDRTKNAGEPSGRV